MIFTARKRRDRERRGAATAELAACAPLLVTLVLGSMQACELIYLKHACAQAAFEGSLELVKDDATVDSVKQRVEQVLQARGVTPKAVKIKPEGLDLQAAQRGDVITVIATAKPSANLNVINLFPNPGTVKARVVSTR